MKKTIIAANIGLCLMAGLCHGAERTYGDIDGAKYVDNYDGDTITVNLPGLPAIFGEQIPVRVNGIDTPERHGHCAKEKALALEAQAVVESVLTNAKAIRLTHGARDKYFRVNASVVADGVDVGALLLQRGLAVPYDGGTKTKNWCE